MASWAAQIFNNVICILQRPCHISAHIGCDNIVDKTTFSLLSLSDTIMFPGSIAKHTSYVNTVLSHFHKASVTLNLGKWDFLSKIDYLGHVTQTSKLELADHTPNGIRYLKPLRNVTTMKSLIDLSHVYHQFVPNFVHIPASLNRSLNKSKLRTFDGLTQDVHSAVNSIEDTLL